MTTKTQSIVHIKGLRKHGRGYRLAETATETLDIAPAYFDAIVNAGDYKAGTVPAHYDAYDFDGEQTFTYVTHDEVNFDYRHGWVQDYLTAELPTAEYMEARAELDKQMAVSLGLGEEPTEEALIALASDASTTPQVLAWLAESLHYKVAMAVIENPNVAFETLVMLAQRENHNGIHYWAYFYDGVSQAAAEAVWSIDDDYLFPGELEDMEELDDTEDFDDDDFIED